MRALAIVPRHLALAMLVWSSCGYVGIELGEGTLADAGELDGGDPELIGPSDAAWQSMDALVGRRPCNLLGTWGARFDGLLSWPAGLLTEDQGRVSMWVKYESTERGAIVSGSLVMCGMTVPDFRIQPLLGDEAYHVIFPDAVFDALPARVVATDTALTIESPGGVDNRFMLAPTGVVLGAQLEHPLTDVWPAIGALTTVDVDMDGQPGMTIDFQSDAGYSLPRVSAFSAQRAVNASLAVRAVLQAHGTFASCSEATGAAEISGYDSRILGCSIEGGGSCNTTQRDLLDENLPEYRVGAGNYRAIKIPDGAS
ncbi:MAG TPA: hypothetical protein VI299_13895, partial [Polyangiales bacterium]